MNTKSDIRLWAKNIRQSLDIVKISEKICDVIRNQEVYKTANKVMIFYPLDNEINLLALLEDDKQFYLPRVNGDTLEVCPYKNGDTLICSSFKVYEPQTESTDKNTPDIIFTPALSVDNSGYRLGYGGGFYDRFFRGVKGLKIAVIPYELVLDKLPSDDYDVRCDGFITQKKASFIRG